MTKARRATRSHSRATGVLLVYNFFPSMDLLASVIVIVAEITDAAAAAATVNGEDEEGEEIDGKLTDFLSPLYSKK